MELSSDSLGWMNSNAMGFYYRKSVNLGHGNLNFTVVIGEILGNFGAQKIDE